MLKTATGLSNVIQVGPGDGYILSVSDFDSGLSTLGDSFSWGNGKRFSAK